MKIPVEGLSGDKAAKFIDYLLAGLGAPVGIEGGTYGPNGAEMVVQHTIGGRAVKLRWSYVFDADGVLDGVFVGPVDAAVGESDFAEYARELVHRVLVSALAERVNRFFQRNTLYYVGPQLSGEYWFGNVRIAPADPGGRMALGVNVEQAVFIDQAVNAIDAELAFAIAYDRARLLGARLGLLLGRGIYQALGGIRIWARPYYEGGPSVRATHGYQSAEPLPNEMPSKPKDRARVGQVGGSVAEMRGHPFTNDAGLLCFPRETRKLLKAVDEREASQRETFDAAARLYQIAMVAGARYETVRVTYLVAAAETVALRAKQVGSASDNGSVKSFSGVMRKYLPDFEHLDLWLPRLYEEIRSAHIHGGKFPLGDFTTTVPFRMLNRDAAPVSGAFAEQLVRTAILRWALGAFGVEDAC